MVEVGALASLPVIFLNVTFGKCVFVSAVREAFYLQVSPQ